MDKTNRYKDSIDKDLNAEASIEDNVAYYRLLGASQIDNFRAPNAYVFIVFEKCRGEHDIDFVKYKEKSLQIHISFPGQIHSWNTAPGAQGHKLILSKYFVENYLFDTVFSYNKTNKHPVLNITKEIVDKLNSDFKILEKELREKEINWQIVILRTQLIVYTFNSLIIKEENTEKKLPLLLQQFYELVDDYFTTNRSVSFYAEKLSITANHLSFLCKQHADESAKDIIDNRILLEAKRLLLGSRFSIKEIGYKLGFSGMSQFSTFIKLKTGYNPKKFKEEYYK